MTGGRDGGDDQVGREDEPAQRDELGLEVDGHWFDRGFPPERAAMFRARTRSHDAGFEKGPRGRYRFDEDLLDEELWPSTLLRLQAAIADRAEAAGNQQAWMAVTSIVVRGRLGLSVEEYCKRTRIPEGRLRHLEGGV